MKMIFRACAILSASLVLTLSAIGAETPQASFASGFELLKAGKAKEAASKFETGLKTDPKNALAHFYLGEAYAALKRPKDAKKQYQASLDLDAAGPVAEKAKGKLAEGAASVDVTQAKDAKDPPKAGPSVEETVAFINSRLSCPIRVRSSNSPHDMKVNCPNNASRCEVSAAAVLTDPPVEVHGETLLLSKYLFFQDETAYENETGDSSTSGKKGSASIEELHYSVTLSKLAPAVGLGKTSVPGFEESEMFSTTLYCSDPSASCIDVNIASESDNYSTLTIVSKRFPGAEPYLNADADHAKKVAELIHIGGDPKSITDALRGSGREQKKRPYMNLNLCEQDSAERVARAFNHLIEISGGKMPNTKPPLF